MTKNILLALVATAALAACNKEDHTIVAGPADDSAVAANAGAPVELPPSILASKKYRCTDNSTVTIDWLSDKKSANLKVGDAVAANQLKADAEGGELVGADGTKLTGGNDAKSVSLTLPGKSALTCHG